MTRGRLTMGLVLLVCLAAAACGPKAVQRGPATQYGGVWQGAINGEPSSLDPAFGVTVLDGELMALVYNGLVRLDDRGEIVEDLAKGWKVSKDGLTYTFTLHRDVRFHSGRVLSADDVVYSFTRVLDPKEGSPRHWVFANIAGATAFRQGGTKPAGLKAVNAVTVQIALEKPDPLFLHRLCMPAAYVVDRKELSRYQDAKAYALRPVGTGPFSLREYTPGDRLHFVANAGYFAGKPYLDGIVYRIAGSTFAAATEFELGNLHALVLPGVLYDRFAMDTRFQPYMVKQQSLHVYYLAMNCEKPPFNDPRVRQAVNYAIDRAKIVNDVIPGRAEVAAGPIPPWVPGHSASATGYAYDPVKARKLIIDAGYPKLFTVTLIQRDAANFQYTRPIQDMLHKIGIKVNIVPVDRTTYFSAVGDKGDFDLAWLSWAADFPDPEAFLLPTFHSTYRGDAGNRARYRNAQVDEVLDRLTVTAGAAERARLVKQAEEIIIADAPWVCMYYPVTWAVHQPEVMNYRLPVIYNGNKMTDVWLKK